jgi:hypothetical protein
MVLHIMYNTTLSMGKRYWWYVGKHTQCVSEVVSGIAYHLWVGVKAGHHM